MRTHLRTELAICSLAAILAGCSILAPQPDRSRFFVLTSLADRDATPASAAPRLGLGPITLPEYLQRPQMVTRIGVNEISLSEIYRWGEPLDANFSRVLAQDLMQILGIERIVAYPWYTTESPDYAISVNVVQFDVDTQGEARLVARWRIADAKSDKTLRVDFTDLREQAADSSPDAAVGALSALVQKLGHELAKSLETLGP